MPELIGREFFAAKDREFLASAFAEITADVTLTVVRKPPSRIILLGGLGSAPSAPGGAGDDAGEVITALYKELVSTSPKLRLVEIDAEQEPARAEAMVGDRLPATMLSSANAKGKLLFYGVPAGHEMATLISTIVELGSTQEAVPEDIAAVVRALPEPVHLRVFVTPSCPHCPAMARAAFQLATYFPNVRADVVEIEEFPEMAQQYQVRGVPKTVINDKAELMGVVPGGLLIQAIVEVAGGVMPEAPPSDSGVDGGSEGGSGDAGAQSPQ